MPPEASSGTGRPEAAHALHALPHLVGRHVVEQHGFGADLHHLVEFVERAHFDLDRLRTATVVQRALKRGNDATGQRDVIVLDENAVAEIEAVIMPAAAE